MIEDKGQQGNIDKLIQKLNEDARKHVEDYEELQSRMEEEKKKK